MNHWRHHPAHERVLTISCDDCSMQCTAACTECVVTFVLQSDAADPTPHGSLVLDRDEARVVELFGRAGLVPELRFQEAG